MNWKFPKFVALATLFLLLTAAVALSRPATAEQPLWTAVADRAIALQGERRVIPQQYLTYQLSLSQMEAALATAPLEFTEAGRNTPSFWLCPCPMAH